MHSVFVLTFLATLLTFGQLIQAQIGCVPSIGQSGTQATCGGFAGAPCPKPTDSCDRWSGSSAGPCCLGCAIGTPSRECSPMRPCGRGQQCNYPLNASSSGARRGVCCARRRAGGY